MTNSDHNTVFAFGEGSTLYIYSQGHLQTADLNNPDERLQAQELLQAPGVLKIGVDIKEALKTLAARDIKIEGPLFDIGIASKLLGKQEEPTATADSVSIDSYCNGLLSQATALTEKLKENGLYRLFSDVEMPLVPVLANMELRGILIDVDALEQSMRALGALKEAHRDDCHAKASSSFNMNSSAELGRCLFDEHDLPPMGKTANGFSTDRKSLELLTKYSPIPQAVMDYRKADTLRDGVETIKANLEPDSAVHPVFNQLGARTGRMSCPSFHSLPHEVRRFFIPRPGYVFLYADYSQVQSRILAHLSGDENYIGLFHRGGDIHRLMASQIFRRPAESIEDDERTRAKKVVYGITNGQGAARIAADLKIPRATAQGCIDEFYNSFPGITSYKEQVLAGLRQKGYVESIMGRRCYYDMADIHSSDKGKRGSVERSAFIGILQMNEADIMKQTMLAVDSDTILRGMGARMLVSVHDSLLVEVREEFKDEAASRLRNVMEGVVTLNVPLKVGVECGYSWGNLVMA